MNKNNQVSVKPTKTKVVKDKKISIDIMHFKSNRSSFWLILLAIALNVAMFIIIYKTNTSDLKADVQLGLDLLINVIVMLACFLAAEKTKRYSKQWGIISIVLGGIQFARIFWIPLYYYLNGGINAAYFAACFVLLAAGAASLIVAGVITLIKYKILEMNKPLLPGAVTAVEVKEKKIKETKEIKEVKVKEKIAPKKEKVISEVFSNVKYTKKPAADPKFDEYVVTFDYKKDTIVYFMFFLKGERVSLDDVKKEFNELKENGELKKYARMYMNKCGRALTRAK